MRIDANSRTWNLLGLLLFAGMALAIFWEVLPWFLAPLAPDAMPFFPFGYRTYLVNDLLATGGEATPHQLYWLIFHPLLANKLNYVVDTLVLALAAAYYLCGRGASRFAAWIGGLALGFSGYMFTLISAGHRGHFDMFCCVVFAFGLLVRCFRGRQMFHFAMLGACLAWGGPYQADVFVFLGMLVGAYALWLTFARASDPATTPWQRVKRVYPRLLLTGLVAVLIGWSGFRKVVDEQIAGRKQQIASTNGVSAGPAADKPVDKRAQWIFATNWSLPPEDMAEFVVPGIFGNDSMQPPYPYWGRLGRAYGWEPGQRTIPNYRQHTVYLGVLTVSFALFAVLVWRRNRRNPAGAASGRAACGSAGEPVTNTPAAADAVLWADVPFWLGAGGVCLLLAMGRYTPFYHLFYAIPYMDLVRCPVKFHHLVEICAAFLCGFGVEAWARGAALAAAPVKRNAVSAPEPGVVAAGRTQTVVMVIAAGAALTAAGLVAVARADTARNIAQLGLGPVADALAGYQISNLLRTALLFGVAAALFGLGRPRVGRDRPAVWMLMVLAAVLALDLGSVARRYIRPIDVGPFYAANSVTDAALAHGGIGVGVANYATGNDVGRDWFASSLAQSGLRQTLPVDPDGTDARVARALQGRTETLWRALHTRLVIARWQAAEPLVRSQVLRPLISFSLGQGTVRQVAPAADACVLAEYAAAMPDTYVVDRWQSATDEQEQVRAMGIADWDPARTTLCDASMAHGGEGRVVGRAQVVRRRGWNFRLTTAVDVETPQGGLLVTDERYAPDLAALLDGQVVPLHRANALWAAVEVPSGRHTVMLRRQSRVLPVLLSAGVGLGLGAWALVRLLGGRRRNGGQTA